MDALWWVLGVTGYVGVAAAAGALVYWLEYQDGYIEDDLTIAVIAGLFWPVSAALAAIFGFLAGFAAIIQLPVKRAKARDKLRASLRVELDSRRDPT